MHLFLRLSFILVVYSSILFSQAGEEINSPEFILIEEDLKSGRIDYDEALLQKFYFMFDKPELEDKYSSRISSPLKCATGLMKEYFQNKELLSSVTINEIENYLNKPFRRTSASAVFISPSGYFELTYSTTGTNAVPSADADNNNVPDYVEWIADYFDYSWAYTIDSLGYSAPPIGSGRYQIGFEEMNYYGYTDFVSGKLTRIVMHRNFNGFPPNTDPDGKQKGAAKATAIHEFKHAVQFVYNNWSDPGWFVEMDATWMEDIGYDNVNDYYNYLQSSQLMNPSRSFSQGSGYEDCLWLHYISEKHGVLSNRLIWERRLTNPNENIYATFNTILSGYASSFPEAISEFFVWNFSTGSRATGLFQSYSEAEKYPTSSICTNKNSLPDSSAGCNLNPASANYLYYKSNDLNRYINILFNASQAGNYNIEVLIVYNNNSTEKISLNSAGSGSLNKLLLKKLKDINYFVLVPVLTSTTGSTRNYTCKVSPFQPAEFIFSPVKDSEDPAEKKITIEVITEYNIALTDSLKLYYKADNDAYSYVKMTASGIPNEYTAIIPAFPAGTSISYYFSIYDTLKNYTFFPETAPSSVFNYYIGTDTIPPVLIHRAKKNINKFNFPLKFFVEADDNLGILNVQFVYRINDFQPVILFMNRLTENLYSIGVPASPELNDGDRFEYFIAAYDSSVNRNQKFFPGDGVISLTLSNGYQYVSDNQVQIKDGQPFGIKDTIEVKEDFTIKDFNLALKVLHNRISDLSIRITPPFGSSAQILHRPWLGTSMGNLKNPDIIFDQEAYFSFSDLPEISGTDLAGEFIPDVTDFDSFNGKSAKGKWIINIRDLETGETGLMQQWKLIFGSDDVTSVENVSITIPSVFYLEQNYPNPFNPSTKINYSIPYESFVQLKIFNMLGEEIALLVNEVKPAGKFNVDFSAANLGSGIYFYRLKAENFISIRKMILTK